MPSSRRTPFDPSFLALFLLGAFLLVLALVPAVGGFVERRLGGLRLVQIALGFALVYLALLVRDVTGLRARNLVVMETLLAAFKGAGIAPREEDAVDILLAALRSPSETTREAALRQLQRITGQDLGMDGAAWEDWWRQHRETFRAERPRPRAQP